MCAKRIYFLSSCNVPCISSSMFSLQHIIIANLHPRTCTRLLNRYISNVDVLTNGSSKCILRMNAEHRMYWCNLNSTRKGRKHLSRAWMWHRCNELFTYPKRGREREKNAKKSITTKENINGIDNRFASHSLQSKWYFTKCVHNGTTFFSTTSTT